MRNYALSQDTFLKYFFQYWRLSRRNIQNQRNLDTLTLGKFQRVFYEINGNHSAGFGLENNFIDFGVEIFKEFPDFSQEKLSLMFSG